MLIAPGTKLIKCRQMNCPCQALTESLRLLQNIKSYSLQCRLAISRHLTCWEYRLLATEGHTRPSFRVAAYEELHTMSRPSTGWNVALHCTASSRQAARPRDRFFRYLSDVKPDCYRASILTSAVLIGAQATPRLAALLPRKILC